MEDEIVNLILNNTENEEKLFHYITNFMQVNSKYFLYLNF